MSVTDIELDIANIIKAIAYYDILIENMKIKLAEDPNFDVNQAWNSLRRVQKTESESIFKQDILTFLVQNKIPASEREAEWLINQNKERSGELNYQGFLKLILPREDEELRQQILYKTIREKNFANQHFVLQSVQKNFSEQEVAKIFLQELENYREVEHLKKSLKQYNLSVGQIYQLVNFRNSKYVDEEILIAFMQKVGVQFSSDECQAFFKRTTIDNDSKLDYQELINALLPYDPFSFMDYRKDLTVRDTIRHVAEKMEEFQLNVDSVQEQINKNQKLRQPTQDPTDYRYPLSKVFSADQYISKCYFYDSGYMKQLRDYKCLFYDTSKNKDFLYSQEKKQGVRYHDNFYEDFYKHLLENDLNEHFFNKFGKKFEYDDHLSQIKQEIKQNYAKEPANYSTTQRMPLGTATNREFQITNPKMPRQFQ